MKLLLCNISRGNAPPWERCSLHNNLADESVYPEALAAFPPPQRKLSGEGCLVSTHTRQLWITAARSNQQGSTAHNVSLVRWGLPAAAGTQLPHLSGDLPPLESVLR